MEIARGREGDIVYQVDMIKNKTWNRFKVDLAMFGMSFKKEGARDDQAHLLIHSYEAVSEALHALVNFLRKEYQKHPQATLRLSIMATGIDAINAKRVPLKFRGAADMILDWLYIVLQSKKETPLDEAFKIHAVIENIPPLAAGSGGEQVHVDPGIKSLKRYLMFPPEFAGPLSDCCLLTSLFLGLAYNRELRAAYRQGRTSLRNPITEEWRLLNYLGQGEEPRAEEAREHVRRGVLQFCSDHEFSPEDFCMADLESLRDKIDAIGINLNIFGAQAGYQVVFKHPVEHQSQKETVSIFLIENPTTGRLHAGLIRQEKKFLSSHRFCVCHFCNRSFHTDYFPIHKCSRRENCPNCLFILALEDDYVDLEIARLRCFAKRAPKVELFCSRCNSRCLTEDCFARHKSICKTKARCDDCGILYKRKERPHQCGDTFCRTCFVFYDRFNPERHVCSLRPPRPQSRYLRLAVWDSETVLGGDEEHRPNAIGVSYETRPGWFSEVCYYDREMKHPHHGETNEDVFFFKYWPDRIGEEKIEKSFYKPPGKKIKGLFMKAAEGTTKSGQRERRRDETTSGFLDAEAAEDVGCDDDEGYESEDEEDIMTINERLCQEEEEEDDLEDFEGSALNSFIEGHINQRFYGTAFLSHNGAKFDSMLLLRGLLKKNFRVRTVFEGNKLLLLEVVALKIFFMDSYRYLKMPLSDFFKRFPSMSCCEEKGIFCYSFNKEENYDYEGPVPPRPFFVDKFTPAKKMAKIDAYLEEEEGKIWNFRERIHEYLLQDVQILRGGVVSLLKEFFEFQESFDKVLEKPFHAFSRPFFTSSSLVHALWKTYGMPEDEIYLVENQRNQRKTSSLELEYLSFLNRDREPHRQIRTAFNSPLGQKRVGRYSLDGFDASSNEAFEFLGCAVHAHSLEQKDCPLSEGMGPLSLNPYKKNCLSVQKEWEKRKEFLESNGITLRCMWECEYLKMKENDEQLKSFLANFYQSRPRERLALRDALRGGRTEAFSLIFDADQCPDREMFYMDLNSLYPFVAINNLFPVGKPETFIGCTLDRIKLGEEGFVDSCTGEKIRGTIQADLLPPNSVFIPTLPVYSDGKLIFGLCGSCIEKKQKAFCKHKPEERLIRGTWTTVEVEVASRNGYKIHKIYEIVAYRKALPVFRDFYTRLATIKIESEGFEGDEGSLSKEEKEEQVKKINDLMPNLNLKTRNVSFNYPRRQFAKGEVKKKTVLLDTCSLHFFFFMPLFQR